MTYVVGIDLGTSNSAVTIGDTDNEAVTPVPITQVMGQGTVGEQRLLPSALYLPADGEYSEGSFSLPWLPHYDLPFVVGSFAQSRGALAPDRVITSAKSWLCNPQVDRRASILPWKSEVAESSKISPLAASTAYLSHLRRALQHHCLLQGSQLDLQHHSVVVTVPASFDEVARSLTHDAAVEAGFGQVVLLEEPQAAFYAWLATHGDSWRQAIQPGDLVLVCDIGGGTSDFSLIAVSEEQGNLKLERVSVGEHILLGGDNIDLALAYAVKAKLQSEGTTLDSWQFLSLVHQARSAKERLLADESIAELPMSVASRGSSLFARTVSTTLTRDEISRIVLDGFFPITSLRDLPQQRPSIGLQEFGLSYASDPAVSKHLARFLVRSKLNVASDAGLSALVGGAETVQNMPALLPSKVLFNGGACTPTVVRERILTLLRSWKGSEDVAELQGTDLSQAVASGACVYAKLRARGEGIRIKAGLSRSYYIGLESAMPAVPGIEPPIKGVCIAPQGMEEGTERTLAGQRFGLVTGEPVEFRFFSSEVRAGDEPGAIVPDAAAELVESSRLAVELPPLEGMTGDVVPVELHAKVTELGVFELWMHQADGIHSDGERRKWKVEFNVRG